MNVTVWLLAYSLVNVLAMFVQVASTTGKPLREGEIVELIQSLVNNNRPPKLVLDAGERLPLFEDGYDWDVQARVVGALQSLYRERTEATWQQLAAHADDKRYCLTIRRGERASNFSIGQLCRELAYDQLVYAVDKHLAPLQRALRASDQRPAYPGYPDDLPDADERKEKRLYELQIEACEGALKEMSQLQRVPEDIRTSVQRALMREIDALRTSGTPTFPASQFPGERNELYSAKSAAEARKLINRKKEK